ncbi:hypothetical protein [Rickettsia prowazekii]|uniref:Uncharacterized protein n=1 Tax=Rickettsia prowazekii (strain Rp22) TaxID=449216 RepID=D5AXE4_RICPP|nr:hypothetical protein [Rickettsia prowazekii]ADE30083.1 conserved hypothetical protein [Rickettsia prowazekii str. Rp22]AGJ01800.1 hypothetical protein H374_5150 [Rickettsia prowazekii str. NMRC Madrid E]AGJ02289.1 hypothetical protein H375_630 [Rickettsia prowazekii str. Breinl]EOB10919.1 Translation initiation factor IF-2 [Rickettsia prowazekii str. Cairo 3]AMS12441.1 translation initiation factor IF-2 [Rickettsia prowazekii]
MVIYAKFNRPGFPLLKTVYDFGVKSYNFILNTFSDYKVAHCFNNNADEILHILD